MENVIKCPYCGGSAGEISADVEKLRCPYCKRWFAIPTKLDLEKQALYQQGKNSMALMHYDEAESAFKKLRELDADYGEAYWLELLAHYGIEYVREISSGEYYPTIARLTNGSILESGLYRQALTKTADDDLRASYMSEAQRINDILVNYRQLALTNVYDVFISVKQGDENGNPTPDSDEALNLTNFLVSNGLRVFNSRISLKNMVGMEYEPYIMAGLMSAKAMIVVGSSREYIESQWVRNEWIRFRNLRDNSREKRILIPYLLDITPKEVPAEMGALQCITNFNDNAYREVLKAIYNVMPIESLPSVSPITLPAFIPIYGEKAEQIFARTQSDLANYVLLENRPMPDSKTAMAAVENMETICSNLKRLHRNVDTTKHEANARRLKDIFLAEYERHKMEEHKAQLVILEKRVAAGVTSYEDACLVRDSLQKINNEARSFKFVIDPGMIFNKATSLLREVQNTIDTLNPERIRSHPMQKALAVGKGFIAGLRRDGTVLIDGKERELVAAAEQWTDITAIAAGDNHLLGLRRDGNVVATGNNRKGQCEVSEFRNIRYIIAVENQSYVIDGSGYCYATGDIPKKHMDVIKGLRDIVFMSVSRDHMVACDSSGRAFAIGKPKDKAIAVNGLIEIRNIFAVGEATIAVREDNHIDVLSDSTKQAAEQQKILNGINTNFHSFVAISNDSFVFLTSGRRLAFVGGLLQRNTYGKVSEWKNIEEIAGNTKGTSIIGLRTDGTLISLKPDELPKWYNLGLPQL